MTAKCIMIQGTGSSVGKSRLVTGLCRIFKQDGFRVAPFKSQNMALNSYITRDGLEMGRAQATQAEACGIQPSVLMNPILLKPRTDKDCQVIVKGKSIGSLSAIDYHEYKTKLIDIVKECYEELAQNNDIIVIEGAGSPAEINLRERDIVNMGMAQLIDAPVVLIGDIDRGGVFAALAGTLLLLTDEERARIKGVIINKFRGELKLLEPGIKMIEDIINRPVLGVIPYTDIYIDEEDSPETEKERLLQKYNTNVPQQKPLLAKILSLPRITNFTDFVPLSGFDSIRLSYVSGGSIGDADIVIIPGSENPKESMDFIRSRGWDKEISVLYKNGAAILGLGSSFPLLGQSFTTTFDTDDSSVNGLGLLNTHIKLLETEPKCVSGKVASGLTYPADILSNVPVEGYRIYSGKIVVEDEATEKFIKINGDNHESFDGLISKTGRVIGTFIHGIFDSPDFTRQFITYLNSIKGNENNVDISKSFDFKKYREAEFDRWADVVRQNLDVKKLYEIMGIEV